MKNFTRQAIKALAKRGGTKRLSAGVYSPIRYIMYVQLERTIRDSLYAACVHVDPSKPGKGGAVVKPIHVVHALKKQGQQVFGAAKLTR